MRDTFLKPCWSSTEKRPYAVGWVPGGNKPMRGCIFLYTFQTPQKCVRVAFSSRRSTIIEGFLRRHAVSEAAVGPRTDRTQSIVESMESRKKISAPFRTN